MNNENIRAFLEIASSGSFQRAAENLHITQSAMSARIKALEDRLNRQLFVRNRNGATLTSGGQIFMQHATTMMRAWERACNEVMLPDMHKQVVGLGIQLNHWQDVGRAWLANMRENAPEIATQVRIDYSDLLMSRLRDGVIDIALVYEPQNRPDTVVEPFVTHDLILVSTAPRQAQRGLVEGYVFVDWGLSFQHFHNLHYPDAPYHRLEFGVSEAAFQHMMRYGGSGYFSRHQVQHHLDNGELFLVENAPSIPLKTYLMYATDGKQRQEMQVALAALKAVV